MEQVFNAGNLLYLTLEHLGNMQVPESGTDVGFVRSAFFSKLHEVRRLLARSVQQLAEVEKQNLFPYTVFDSAAFANAPEDVILEFFIQGGRLCANVYIVNQAHHQSPSHRPKSAVHLPLVTGSGSAQTASNFYFYNGAPVEVSYSTRLEAILPSAITALSSVENAIGLLDDLCEKIECVQQLLESY